MKTHINGNTIEQVLTNAVTLTQAQYDALPLEQKNHGTYIISDSDSPNISANNVEYSTGVSVKDKIDELSATKIRSGIISDIDLTANTQAEITVTIPNSPFSGGDYAISVDFEYYASANIFTHVIRNAYSNGFVVRVISTVNASGVKMHWTAIKTS